MRLLEAALRSTHPTFAVDRPDRPGRRGRQHPPPLAVVLVRLQRGAVVGGTVLGNDAGRVSTRLSVSTRLQSIMLQRATAASRLAGRTDRSRLNGNPTTA